MSRTIKVILPVSSDEDIVSVITDEEDISTLVQSPSHKHNSSDIAEDPNVNTRDANNRSDVRSTVNDFTTNLNLCGTPRSTRHIQNNWRQQLEKESKPHTEQQQDGYGFSEQQQKVKPSLSQTHLQKAKLSLPQTQYQVSGDVCSRRHVVIIDKNPKRSSAPFAGKAEQRKTLQQTTGNVRKVRLSATEAYDIDLEHRDMMMKALRFYTQYCRNEGSTHCMECYKSYRPSKEPFGVIPDFNLRRSRSYSGSTPSCGSTRISRCVKMAQCRLRFYDDVDKASCEDMSTSQKTTPIQYSKPLLYTLDDADGVLADAMGHTYRSTQTRPWSVLPGTMCGDCKRSYYRMCSNCGRRFPKTASVTRDNNNIRKLQRSDLNATSQLKVVALALTDSMSQPIPRSVAYQRRNQTTHLWTDSSNLMSRSVPTANFLHRHFSSASSSPRSSQDDSEKTSKARPSSSYSYDGGFFVGAHSGQAEYFVIHPDWVSEAMTVKKASIGDKRPGSSLQRSISLTSRMLPEGRRCLSAPPKQRNPITMEHAERESAGTKCQQ